MGHKVLLGLSLQRKLIKRGGQENLELALVWSNEQTSRMRLFTLLNRPLGSAHVLRGWQKNFFHQCKGKGA